MKMLTVGHPMSPPSTAEAKAAQVVVSDPTNRHWDAY